MLKIYFCFPCRGVGGVSLLFLRLAEYLTHHELAECHLVDYADGYMARMCRTPGVQLEIYADKSEYQVIVPPDALVIFQSMTPWSIFPGVNISLSARIIYWNCYPFNLIPLFPGLRRVMQRNEQFARVILHTVLMLYRAKMRRLVRLMSLKQSLVFMDKTNVATTERYLDLVVDQPVYIPIPVPRSINKTACDERLNGEFRRNGLRVVWIGRIVDFKFFTLLHSLRELDRIQTILSMKITVTIVGSGDWQNRLKKEVSNLSKISCVFIDYVAPGELDDFLIRNADLLLAMGTSALEGAKLGIPTLLLDLSHVEVSSNYVFTWLHERTGYDLGGIVSEGYLVDENTSMLDHINELIFDFSSVSHKTLNYFEANHEISNVVKKMLEVISQASCTYGDLQVAGLLERGRIYTMFTKIREGALYL